MKLFKRLMAVMFAISMLFGMGTKVYAGSETKHTITITNEHEVGDHTYEAYQVFKGDLTEQDNKKVLSNITWGNGVNESGIITAIKADTATFGSDAAKVATAEDVAKLLKNVADDSAAAKKFAEIVGKNLATKAADSVKAGDGSYTITVTGDGYYFIKDSATLPLDTDKTDPHQGDSQTRYILEVVGDVEVKAKTGTVESKKKVQDINDSDATPTLSGLQDSADYDIGDSIPYTLTFTLPANYGDYKTYAVKFVDDISEGLTFNADAKIYYGDADTVGESITFTKAENVWTAAIADLKALTLDAAKALKGGDVITIKYTATLNANAVIGSAGNPNTYHVEYSNNPNGTGTGTTPDDKNIVFTYKTIFNKVKEDGTTALTGADFKLEKKVNGAWVDVIALHTGEGAINPTKTGDDKGSTFTFSGLDDGDYKLTETKTPKGYNSIDPIEFTISATHDITSDDPKLTALTGTDGAEFVLTPNIPDGSLTGKVVNKEGSTLPSTGGIGTTIFYVLGGLLVLGSGIVLVARRKASE